MASNTLTVRELIAAQGDRIKRVKRLDRFAVFFITLGGIGIVASVLGILLFILAEAWPLFRSSQGTATGTVALVTSDGHVDRPLALGTDEYQLYAYDVTPDAAVHFFRLEGGKLALSVPFPGLAGAGVTAASRSLTGDFLAAGTADGRVALAQVRFRPQYDDAQQLKDLEIEVRDRGLVAIDPAGRTVRQVSYSDDSGRKAVAALVADDEVALWHRAEDETEALHTLRTRDGERITTLDLARPDALAVGTEKGNVYHWEIEPELRLTDVVSVGSSPVTAIEWLLGGTTFLAGNQAGELTGWFRVRLRDDDADKTLVNAHQFENQGAPVTAIAAATRDRSFATLGADGSVVLHHGTSERTLLRLPAAVPGGENLLITPKNDGLLVSQPSGELARYSISNPHPEVTWKSLFGKVWYEGYAEPAYVWQSTGATDDFETKFSLVPLMFGTIKGTLYALLFAIPIAVGGALYTSQFMHPSIRGRVKPTVEIMAALPSVVIGFVAGLWLAPMVERHVVAVILMLVVLPLSGTAGILVWNRLPQALSRRLKPGMELFVLVPMMALGGWLALQAGPWVEAAVFPPDFKLWLSENLALTYDQRNSLVVGLAMGFAVIPIIFTISEDAFSAVPSSLSAASLALGASRWQTATRVVLPTASPGVFSAVMIGFGRAVGETMIVLMATGNTPVLDWSIFNGMRTLSANIAVEIPEAPYGGTLYRVLFLAGALLFAMTFVVNTIAEVIRQRLRERYRAI
jgi:phosphate transport system permease protein